MDNGKGIKTTATTTYRQDERKESEGVREKILFSKNISCRAESEAEKFDKKKAGGMRSMRPGAHKSTQEDPKASS